jgi:hypothetical protein
MKRISIAALFALAGCGGGTTNLTTDPSANCTITLSGALTGTLGCTGHDAAYNSANNTGGFAITAAPAATVQSFSMAVGTTGQPTTGTFTQSSGSLNGSGVVVQGTGNQIWSASVGSGTQGTFSLVVRDLGSSISANGGTAWPLIHGTFNATLPAVAGSGATGSVTVTASF